MDIIDDPLNEALVKSYDDMRNFIAEGIEKMRAEKEIRTIRIIFEEQEGHPLSIEEFSKLIESYNVALGRKERTTEDFFKWLRYDRKKWIWRA